MNASFSEPRHATRRIAPLGLAACVLLLLGACAEKEIIFKGEREDIREMTADTSLERAPDEADNVSRAIRLPSQVNNASWQQSIGTASHRVAHPALGSNPARIWSANIGSGDGRRVRITADPVVANGLIYTLDSGARVSAVNTSGQVVWSVDLIPVTDDEEDATGGGMAYDKGTLYVSSGYGRLTALDATSGAVRWHQRLESTGSGTPMIDNGLIYLVAGDDTGWAINTKDGRVEWQIEAAPSVANVLGAPAPAIAGDYVVFAFGSGELTAAFKRGGLRRWSTNVGGGRVGQASSRISDITGSPVVVGRTIYAGNHSGRTAAISTLDGKPVWTARNGALGPVWPAGDSVFAVTEQRQLVRFDANSGVVVWARDLPGYVKQKPKRRAEVYGNYGPILAGGRLVVASNDGFLRFFSPQDGSLVGQAEVPGGATTAPVVANGTLYVVGTTGQLHAFR
ncbi:PQQ-like beta-propeller repeat protein [Arenibacterium halophilum]|uniref:Quinoprotein n=1 Tax=Arenibacterium halophilum TaxID=2583821 RepID=A0ABY2XBY8_9RHOB|nr:PQQ-like beta-propeller repeat protein [Arenibacterium halophilum]TMV13267.1 quinoprotein [Arenibacterium halophilum]